MNVFYFKKINSIGGVESWFWYLSCIYKDMVVYYREGDSEQIKRLAKNIQVRKYNEEEINCDNFFCCYGPDIIDKVKAKRYYHIIHCDYKQMWFSPILNDKFDKYIAVSKVAGESFKEITGKDYELIYNPIEIEIPKTEKYNDGKLHLISATRLTREKGIDRMIKLANILNKNNIPFEWEIYTTKKRKDFNTPNVIYKKPKLDIIEDISRADFLVQLSDSEAFCYSVVEALICGVPCITTNLPVFEEIGLKHAENAIICNFEMSNVNIDLLKKKFDFKYKPPKSNWDKYLKKESDYNPKDEIEVKAKRRYTDIQKGLIMKNQVLKMTNERASYLESRDLIEIINNNTVL